MANNHIDIKCNVCGETLTLAKSYCKGFGVSPLFSVEKLDEFFDKHAFCLEGEKLEPEKVTEGNFSLEYEEPLTESDENISEWIVDESKYGNDNLHCKKCGAIVEKDEEARHFWAHCYNCGRKMIRMRGIDMLWEE